MATVAKEILETPSSKLRRLSLMIPDKKILQVRKLKYVMKWRT